MLLAWTLASPLLLAIVGCDSSVLTSITMLKAAFLGLVPAVIAIPAAAPVAEPTVYQVLAVRAPEPTEVVALEQRGIVDSVESYVDGLVTRVESKLSAWVDSGILDYPNGFPTGDAVKKSLGISDDDDELAAQPTQVLNLP